VPGDLATKKVLQDVTVKVERADLVLKKTQTDDSVTKHVTTHSITFICQQLEFSGLAGGLQKVSEQRGFMLTGLFI